MRPATILFATVFLATAASAANIRFDPPNPTSRTPITAHVVGSALTGCAPDSATLGQAGDVISITLHFPQCPLTPPGGGGFDFPVDLGTFSAGVYRVVAGTEAEGTLIVRETNPPFQVRPNVGYAGDRITITGKDLEICAGGPSPPVCAAYVKFSSAVAEIVSSTADQIVVLAPVHDPGAVDVSVGPQRAIASFYYVSGNPDSAFYEPVLFPIAFSGPGAFGSLWETELTLRNENDYPLTAGPVDPVFVFFCFPSCDFRPPAHATIQAKGARIDHGHVMLIPRQAAPNLHFSVLVKDLSRQSETLGTEITVVREKDLFDRPFQLLNVPTDPRFRVALRLYDVAFPRLASVTIQPLGGDDKLISASIQLSATTPAYAQISDLVAAYPQLAGRGALRITIGPGYDGGPATLWGFVSVTNNETQQLTTISPQ